MGCTRVCWAETFLTIINLLTLIVSIYLLVDGLVNMESNPSLSVFFTFFNGIGFFIMAILGFFAVSKESFCLMVIYALLVVIFIIQETVIIILVSKSIGTLFREYAINYISKVWDNELDKPGAMDYMQRKFHCCGKDSPDDYKNLNRKFPPSCYGANLESGQILMFETGCIKLADEVYSAVTHILVAKISGDLVGLMIQLSLSICLMMHYRSKPRQINP